MKIVDQDFSEDDRVYVPKIKKELEGLDIGILVCDLICFRFLKLLNKVGELSVQVNNVGVGYGHPEFLLQLEDGEEKLRQLVAVNVTSVNTMTQLVLPQLVAKGKGAVVNISSSSCMFPAPMLSGYAATKAYVDNFTANLEVEYRAKGITIQCVLPGKKKLCWV